MLKKSKDILTLSLWITFISCGAHSSQAKPTLPLTLTDAGKPAAAIVLAAESPNTSAQFAAFELQDQIRKISGATLPIVTDREKVDGLRILVGESQATRALGLKNADFAAQEYLIRFLPDTIVLMGYDQPGSTGKVDYANPKTYPDLWTGMATCYAVYDFLERYYGVRWYAPGDLGTVFEQRPTLVVNASPEEIRRKPKMISRSYQLGNTHVIPTVQLAGPEDKVSSADWMRWLLRLRMGGEAYQSAHSSGSLYFYHWDKIKPDHPWSKEPPMKDWFQGKRPELFAKGYEKDPKAQSGMASFFAGGQNVPPQPCISEPGTLKFFAERAKDYLDSNDARQRWFQGLWIGGKFFPFHWDDNYSFCKCPACQEQFNKTEAHLARDFKGNGRFSNGYVSKYYFNFINKLAKEIAKTNPGRFVGSLAYAQAARHPGFELEPNVAVQLCMSTRNFWCPATRDGETAIYSEWIKKEGGKRPLYLWLYYEFPVEVANRQFKPFPGFFARQVADDWKRYNADGINGFFIQTSWCYPGSFLHDQLELHLVSKLSDDPTLDGQKLIAEFFTRYYGAAAKPMREFYELIEKTYNDPNNYPEDIRNGKLESHQTEEIAWNCLGTKERMEKLAGLMAAAKAAAKTENEKQRVALFERGIWLPMLQGTANYAKAEVTKKALEKLKNRPPVSASVPRLAAGAQGDPAKVDWAKAAPTGAWSLVTGFPSERQIEARLAHDGEFLYVRLSDPSVAAAKLVNDKANIWAGDDWEVMLGEKAAKPYRQAMIAPDGRKAGLNILSEDAGHFSDLWDDGWTAVSKVENGTWTALLALPLKTIAPSGVKPGMILRGNFFRHLSGDEESLSWSPNFTRSFHVPERFGELKFE